MYAIKLDLTHKSCLVCNGSRVDPKDISTCANAVKDIPVQRLDIIAELQGLRVLTGGIENSFIQNRIAKKGYICVEQEFGAQTGKIALIVSTLYGFTTSAEQLYTMLAGFLHTIGFIPSRHDQDVWIF